LLPSFLVIGPRLFLAKFGKDGSRLQYFLLFTFPAEEIDVVV